MLAKLPPSVLHRGIIKGRILVQTFTRMVLSFRVVNFQTRISALTTITRSLIEVNPIKIILPVRMKTQLRGKAGMVMSLGTVGVF